MFCDPDRAPLRVTDAIPDKLPDEVNGTLAEADTDPYIDPIELPPPPPENPALGQADGPVLKVGVVPMGGRASLVTGGERYRSIVCVSVVIDNIMNI